MDSRLTRQRSPWLALLAIVAISGLAIQTVAAAKPVAVTFVDYAQCANGAPPSASLACPDGWINGILQASNSHYSEDQVTPQRAADRCQGLAAADCPGGASSAFPIPDDPQVLLPFSPPSNGITSNHMLPASTQAECNAYAPDLGNPAAGTYPSRCLIMYGGTITGMTVPVHDCVATGKCNDPSVDDYASVTVTFSVSSFPKKVQLLFGGHLALGSTDGSRTWGSGNGSSDISGDPYHIKWTAADGASIGNRDNQIMG